MLKDTQQIVDILDREIKEADKEHKACKEGPSDIEAAKKGYYLRGLLRAQTIFLENITLPF